MPLATPARTPAASCSLLAGLAFLLTGCSGAMDRDPTDGIYDPNETRNRKVHEFNKELDRNLIRPLSIGYTRLVPDDIEDVIANFSVNFGQPRVTVNSLLQGDLRGTGVSVSRFLINSTLGFVGLFDVATDFGVEQHDTNFGETLYVWGFGEGPYIEAPFLGPATLRAGVGNVVDLFTNPLYFNLDRPARYIGPTTYVASSLGYRGRFPDTVDSVLYDSADSYSQARLIYMQNRRFELGIEDDSPEIDPFALDTEGF